MTVISTIKTAKSWRRQKKKEEWKDLKGQGWAAGEGREKEGRKGKGGENHIRLCSYLLNITLPLCLPLPYAQAHLKRKENHVFHVCLGGGGGWKQLPALSLPPASFTFPLKLHASSKNPTISILFATPLRTWALCCLMACAPGALPISICFSLCLHFYYIIITCGLHSTSKCYFSSLHDDDKTRRQGGTATAWAWAWDLALFGWWAGTCLLAGTFERRDGCCGWHAHVEQRLAHTRTLL